MFLVQSGSMETHFIQILLDVSEPRYTEKFLTTKKRQDAQKIGPIFCYGLHHVDMVGVSWDAWNLFIRKIREIFSRERFEKLLPHKCFLADVLSTKNVQWKFVGKKLSRNALNWYTFYHKFRLTSVPIAWKLGSSPCTDRHAKLCKTLCN